NQEEIPEWMHYGLKGSVEQLFIPTNQPLQAELTHFINCVNGQATPRISGEDALNALRVIWQVQQKLGFFTQDNTIETNLAIAAE
ncbi:MAG: hypothetical protein IJX20_03680, partial [Alphaproteobacteria bacterium]|nr:hypothetical protein [Alphaproteobacteria bacterium]